MAYTLMMDADGHAVVKDGKPVFKSEDGQETVLDANEAFNKIHALGEESKGWRLKLKESAEALKGFEGIDIEQVKKNAEIAERFKEHEMAKNGEIEKLKADIADASNKKLTELQLSYENKLTALVGERDTLKSSLENNTLKNYFLNSKYINDEMIIPADIAMNTFGRYFKVDFETGKVVAKSEDGSDLLSVKNLTQTPDFEEAIELIVKKYPHKDRILKASGIPGGGMGKDGRGGRDSQLDNPMLSAEARINLARQKASGS